MEFGPSDGSRQGRDTWAQEQEAEKGGNKGSGLTPELVLG